MNPGLSVRSRLLRLTLCSSVLLALLASVAQPFRLDPKFNLSLLNSSARFGSIALQPDGKILAHGAFSILNGAPADRIVRLLDTGLNDPSFLPPDLSRGDDFAPLFALRDGGFIISQNGHLTRVNADGSPDKNFKAEVEFQGLGTLREQVDGKLLLAGRLSTNSPLVRLEADGKLDLSFSFVAPPNIDLLLTELLLQSNGKIIVAGQLFGSTTKPFLARLNPNGSVDSSFTNDSTSTFKSFLRAAIAGKLVWISEQRFSDGSRISTLQRLEENGQVDTSFQGFTFTGSVSAVCPLSSGTVFIAGFFPDHPPLIRLNSHGELVGEFLSPSARVDVLESDQAGRALIAYNQEVGEKVDRLLESGESDSTFRPALFQQAGAEIVALENSGTLLLGGNIVRNGQPLPLMRVDSLGRTDYTFEQNIARAVALCQALAVDKSSNIYVAGAVRSIGGGFSQMARFSASGDLDLSFARVDTASQSAGITSVLPVPNGQVLVGGGFSWIAGETRNELARLNNNGSLDETFDPGNYVLTNPLVVSQLALGPDGKVYAVGYSTPSGAPSACVIRLFSDGTPDPSFAGPQGSSFYVQHLMLLPDGKLLIAGFLPVLGSPPLARLNSDGSVDTIFGSQFQSLDFYLGGVDGFVAEPDGNLILAGRFYPPNNLAVYELARFTSDGRRDATFGSQLPGNSLVHSMLLHPDGSLYVSGDFTSISGQKRIGIARFEPDSPLSFTAPEALLNLVFRSYITNTPGNRLVIESSSDLTTWSLLKVLTPSPANYEFLQPLTARREFYRMRSE